MTIFKITAILVVLFVVGMVVSMCGQDIYVRIRDRKLDYKKTRVQAKVINKVKIPEHTNLTMMPIGRICMPKTIYCPEEYYVTILWDGDNYDISSFKLFQKANVGQKVDVTVYKGYNKKGKCKKIYITE